MIAKNDPLAQEFFFVFSRLEYALKITGCLCPDATVPVIDWTRFATSVEHVFSHPPTKDFAEAIQYLSTQPPRKQIVREGRVTWSDGTPRTDVLPELILLYVRRVRNNLFHGGKFRQHRLEYQERTPELLHHCLIVINTCLAVDSDVHDAFHVD